MSVSFALLKAARQRFDLLPGHDDRELSSRTPTPSKSSTLSTSMTPFDPWIERAKTSFVAAFANVVTKTKPR